MIDQGKFGTRRVFQQQVSQTWDLGGHWEVGGVIARQF